MECVFSFYSIGVECSPREMRSLFLWGVAHSSGATDSKSVFKANHRDNAYNQLKTKAERSGAFGFPLDCFVIHIVV
jgi:hypothetical protein